MPIALTVAGGTVFRMHGRLGSRPMDVYRDLFVPRGVRWYMGVGADGAAELTVCGKMEPGDYVLPGDVSSQFVSGLLFALPLLPGNSTLTVQQPVESESYIRMTIEAIAASGIEVQESSAFSWRIPGHQQYKSHSCHLNGDYSQAAVLCCAGALGHDITVTHLSPVTTQGDRAILRHLTALGATVEESDNHIRVKAGKLHGATLDMHDCPDIAPILALTAQLAEGESRLTHCGRLRLKECDRLAATGSGASGVSLVSDDSAVTDIASFVSGTPFVTCTGRWQRMPRFMPPTPGSDTPRACRMARPAALRRGFGALSGASSDICTAFSTARATSGVTGR